jgi:hypothetical protein
MSLCLFNKQIALFLVRQIDDHIEHVYDGVESIVEFGRLEWRCRRLIVASLGPVDEDFIHSGEVHLT